MDPFATFVQAVEVATWELSGLDPSPEEEWQRMKEFLGIGQEDLDAMVETVDVLFRRGYELVVGTYDYLLQNPETAAILGWERGADPEHLAERRRFFTIWLARTLGMDFSNDFAHYLFHAGRIHAGHGPRHIHVPPVYITGAVSLVNVTFARFLAEEMPGHPVIPQALAAWNKVLSMHLHLMNLGYQAARELDTGDFAVPVAFFGKLRTVVGVDEITVHLPEGATVETALRKLFNYFPQARSEVFELAWEAGEREDATGTPWFEPEKVYRVKPMWRVLLNGKDISYIGGPKTPVHPGDKLEIFPPGR